MRLFVGIFPPEQAVADLSTLVQTLDLTRRMVPPERWHITIAFLGDVAPELEANARAALDESASRIGDLRLCAGGRFGPVLWAGVTGDVPGLIRLSRGVRRAMRARRLHPDDKRFRPHLTLARSAEDLSTVDGDLLRAYQGPSWPVTEMVLVRSELGPNPQYHRLGVWPLAR